MHMAMYGLQPQYSLLVSHTFLKYSPSFYFAFWLPVRPLFIFFGFSIGSSRGIHQFFEPKILL